MEVTGQKPIDLEWLADLKLKLDRKSVPKEDRVVWISKKDFKYLLSLTRIEPDDISKLKIFTITVMNRAETH